MVELDDTRQLHVSRGGDMSLEVRERRAVGNLRAEAGQGHEPEQPLAGEAHARACQGTLGSRLEFSIGEVVVRKQRNAFNVPRIGVRGFIQPNPKEVSQIAVSFTL